MIKILAESFLQIALLLPFAILFLKEKSKISFIRLLIFVGCYVAYQLFLVLPSINAVFDVIESRWNWEGKALGIICGISCYFIFRRYFHENDFFTLKQNRENLKPTLIVAVGVVLLSVVVWFLLGKSEFDMETLAFQISLPGVDEEIMFRGILLGLLASSLKEKTTFVGNPSVLLTAILFGLMHSLTLDKNYAIDFESIYFIQTTFAGYLWGWITLKSRSILLAILSHNFSNFFGTLATMIK
ncbi:CPBP family intramembrane glutamic endopeptidase [Capnocytophaga canis]|uniref:CPBP family intramembrane glutamic endopeptidase n=1 Tax=Capnocytophaga canis TaxID=1848903 RepID=UPI00370D4A1F